MTIGTEIRIRVTEETETDAIITIGIATITEEGTVITMEMVAMKIGATTTEIINTEEAKTKMMTDEIIGATVDARREDDQTIDEMATDATTEEVDGEE